MTEFLRTLKWRWCQTGQWKERAQLATDKGLMLQPSLSPADCYLLPNSKLGIFSQWLSSKCFLSLLTARTQPNLTSNLQITLSFPSPNAPIKVLYTLKRDPHPSLLLHLVTAGSHGLSLNHYSSLLEKPQLIIHSLLLTPTSMLQSLKPTSIKTKNKTKENKKQKTEITCFLSTLGSTQS